MSEWQPIETAPKDGTDILTYDETNFTNPYAIAGYFPHLGTGTSYVWFDPQHETPQCPSHWMPIPEPPK